MSMTSHDDKHHHDHHVSTDADKRYLSLALALLLGFMAVEIALGVVAGSLALISDAGHMLADAGALGLALFAMAAARKPARGSFTWGFKRVEILSAQANGITLLLLAAWFLYEAVRRLIHPSTVHGALVWWTAVAGVAINLVIVLVMRKANRQSLNIQGSYQHLLTDLYAFIATAVAGGVIWLTGFNRADALAAMVVAGLMARAGYMLVRDSGRIFMEAAPRNMDPDIVAKAILAMPAVTGLADLHIWEVTSGLPALSAHINVHTDVDCHAKRREIATMLRTDFGINHATLQTDHAAVADARPTHGCNMSH